METKRFCFSGNIHGNQKDFIVKAPVVKTEQTVTAKTAMLLQI